MTWTLALAAAATLGSGCIPLEEDRILGRHIAAAQPALAVFEKAGMIAFTPAPGIRRRFSPAELARLATRHGIALPDGAPTVEVCFERPSAVLTEAQLMAAMRTALPADAQLELVDFCRIPVPKGELEFTKPGLALPPGGSVRLPVVWRGRVRYSKFRSVPVWTKVRAWVRRNRVVAGDALPAGTPIEARQLRVESSEAPPFSVSGPSRIDEVAGRILRRSLPAGQPVPAALISTPNDVERGQTVAVDVLSGSAHLKFQAKAESGGRAGDTVVVRNPESNRRFRARVSGRGAVIIDETGVAAGGGSQ